MYIYKSSNKQVDRMLQDMGVMFGKDERGHRVVTNDTARYIEYLLANDLQAEDTDGVELVMIVDEPADRNDHEEEPVAEMPENGGQVGEPDGASTPRPARKKYTLTKPKPTMLTATGARLERLKTPVDQMGRVDIVAYLRKRMEEEGIPFRQMAFALGIKPHDMYMLLNSKPTLREERIGRMLWVLDGDTILK